MDRCVVEGCIGEKLNGTNNTRQKILFKVPNDPDLLNKWCIALNQLLEPGDRVCNIHFKENDIFKNLSTFTKLEGQKTLMFKKRVKLKQGAVPIPIERDPPKIQESDFYVKDEEEEQNILEDNKQNNDTPDLSVSSNGDEEQVLKDIEQSKNDESKVHSSFESNEDGAEKFQTDNIDQDVLTEPEIQDTILVKCENDFQNAKEQSIKKTVVDKGIKNGVVIIKRITKCSETDDSNTQSQTISQKRKLHVVCSQNKLPKIAPYETSITQNKIQRSVWSYSPSKVISCFDELKYIIQQRSIRPQWCAKSEQKSVYFSYVDFDFARVNCCLEVTEDFKVNAYTADKIIAIYVATSEGVRSIAEIIEVMKVLEKKRWCLGPGVPSVSRSPDCVGAMPVKTVSDSCNACLKEKIDSVSHTRELATCRIKLEESRHKYELMRKKHHYANDQYERLKTENKILSFQMEEAKKTAINEIINRLPSLQQCVVRYLIHSSYTPKCAQRYTESYLNECLVIRAMSPAVYEYLRRKQLLPLPCLETLKKHKFKFSPTDESVKDPLEINNLIGEIELPVTTQIPTETTEPIVIIESTETCDFPEIAEAIQMAENPVIAVPTDMPELSNSENCNVVEIVPEYIVSEEVVYEETVCSYPIEEGQLFN